MPESGAAKQRLMWVRIAGRERKFAVIWMMLSGQRRAMAPRASRVGADVGAPETIDRLLGIADHEESASAQTAVLPARRAVVGGDAKQDLRLDRVGILEFVDEDVPIALPERATHRIVPAHERARPLQEIVEVENGGGAFEGGVVGEHLIELIGQLGDQRGRDTAEDHAVTVIDARKMAAGLVVELGAAILAGGLVPCRLRPWRQQIEGVAPHARQARRMSEPPERVEDRRRREAAGEVIGQRLELSDQFERLGLDRLRRKPAAEIRDGLDEIDVRPAAEIGRGRPRAAMLQAKPRKRLARWRPRDADRTATGRRSDRRPAPVRSAAV